MKITSFLANMKPYQLLIILLVVQTLIGFLINKSKYRKYIGQILVSTTILNIGVIFYLITYTFPVIGTGSSGTSASTVPKLWIGLMIPASIVYLIGVFRGTDKEDPEAGSISAVFIVVLQVIISVVLFKYIGYYVSSVLFLFTCMYFLGYRNIKTISLVSLGWVLLTYFVFHKILYVPLPIGKIFELFI